MGPRSRLLLFVLFTSLTGTSCGFLAGKLPSNTDPTEGIGNIKLPAGFRIDVYATGIDGARSMTLSPQGIVFVGTRGEGKVYAVRTLLNGTRDVVVIAKGLNSPNGVAFRNGSLYVAEISRVLRFDGIEAQLDSRASYSVVSDSFPDESAHGWKFIAFGPDGLLYIPVGMPCNTCESKDKRFGTIMRMLSDGSRLEIFAGGVRNTVGFDWHPETKELWFTENGRDWLGDDLPPDELNRAAQPGMHFGFPYFYGRNYPDPAYEITDTAGHTPATLELGAHVAALGMRFYTGRMFPERYRNGIFIAEHGSWNRSSPVGYRVMFVQVKNNRPTSYEVFAEGWLQGVAAWGRPVDVLVMPDGSLLVSDDKADAIYRITYAQEKGQSMMDLISPKITAGLNAKTGSPSPTANRLEVGRN